MPEQARITKVAETTGIDEKSRMPTPYISITFMVGDHGPFTHQFRKSEFKPELARQHIEQFARDLARLTD